MALNDESLAGVRCAPGWCGIAAVVLVWGCVTSAWGQSSGRVDVRSPVRYEADGVTLLDGSGREVGYRQIALLEEKPYDPAVFVPLLESVWPTSEDPGTAADYLKLGERCLKLGLVAEARRAFQKALALAPESEVARIGLGLGWDGEAWVPAAEAHAVQRDRLTRLDEAFSDWARGAEAHAMSKAKRGRRGDAYLAERKALIGELAEWCRTHRLNQEENLYLNEIVMVTEGWPGDSTKWGPRLEVMNRLASKIEHRWSANRYRAPVAGRWIAMVDTNRHHRTKYDMMYSIDFQKVSGNDRVYSGSPGRLRNWYSFGEPVYAIADGEVSWAKDGADDPRPGTIGRGLNSVTIRHANGEASSYGHLMRGSVKVEKGDQVAKGQMIGRVGNSGQSGVPHLHFTVSASSIEALWVPEDAGYRRRTIGQSVPFYLEDFRVERVGNTRTNFVVEYGRPQEGWVMVFREPEGSGR